MYLRITISVGSLLLTPFERTLYHSAIALTLVLVVLGIVHQAHFYAHSAVVLTHNLYGLELGALRRGLQEVLVTAQQCLQHLWCCTAASASEEPAAQADGQLACRMQEGWRATYETFILGKPLAHGG